MNACRHIATIALTALLPACATIIEGSGQNVTVETNPPGATCVVERQARQIGAIAATPGTLRLDKSKNDISVTCSKPGFTTTSIVQSSKFVGTTFGNLIIGGGVGFIVDASTGANFTYPATVKVDLAPAGQLQAVPPAPSPGTPPTS